MPVRPYFAMTLGGSEARTNTAFRSHGGLILCFVDDSLIGVFFDCCRVSVESESCSYTLIQIVIVHFLRSEEMVSNLTHNLVVPPLKWFTSFFYF